MPLSTSVTSQSLRDELSQAGKPQKKQHQYFIREYYCEICTYIVHVFFIPYHTLYAYMSYVYICDYMYFMSGVVRFYVSLISSSLPPPHPPRPPLLRPFAASVPCRTSTTMQKICQIEREKQCQKTEDMLDTMPERLSEPEGLSEEMPERMPEEMPERISDRMSEDMPERMSIRMSEGMPERMSGRMSGDVQRRSDSTNVRKNIRRYARRNVRQNVRRYAKTVRQNVRKNVRQNARKTARKNVRRHARKSVRRCLVMKALASDQTVGLGTEGPVLLAEIHNEGDVNVAVLKCHDGGHSK